MIPAEPQPTSRSQPTHPIARELRIVDFNPTAASSTSVEISEKKPVPTEVKAAMTPCFAPQREHLSATS